VTVEPGLTALPIGKAELRQQGSEVAILAWGSLVTPCESVAQQLGATLVNMRFIKPLDEALLLELAGSHKLLVTVEENVIAGGAGSAVSEFLQAQGITLPLLQIGLPDRFVEQGSREQLLALCGLDAEGILKTIKQRLG
jgi:1-deoxy-D-xylulose-5-phosphate synthase